MLCERCQRQEATIHWTFVVGTTGELSNHNFCPVCYPEVEVERLRSYNLSSSPPPFPIDIERITAAEYLDAAARAERNGDDKPAFHHILVELEAFPQTRQRLAFEMLPMMLKSLESGTYPPHNLPSFVLLSTNFIESQHRPEFASSLEKYILRCFDLADARRPVYWPSAHTVQFATLALHRVDKARSASLLSELKSKCRPAETDSRREFIARIEWIMSQAQKKDVD